MWWIVLGSLLIAAGAFNVIQALFVLDDTASQAYRALLSVAMFIGAWFSLRKGLAERNRG